MSKVTEKDLEKVNIPCKSCDVYAVGRGTSKKIYCGKKPVKLIGDWQSGWDRIPDCPLIAQQ